MVTLKITMIIGTGRGRRIRHDVFVDCHVVPVFDFRGLGVDFVDRSGIPAPCVTAGY